MPGNSMLNIGVIITARDMEDYIHACLVSCLNNARYPTEIHIANDGSSDNTAEIIESFIEKNNQEDVVISLYHTGGIGPGLARNRLIKKVNTDILVFVDADDLICRRTLDDIAERLMADSADIGIANISTFSEKTGRVTPFDSVRQKILRGCIPQGERFALTNLEQTPELAGIETSMCMKVFRNSFLQVNQIRFTEGLFCEDVLPSVTAICKASRILLGKDTQYFYRIDRSGQRTTKINPSTMHINEVAELVFASEGYHHLNEQAKAHIIALMARLITWSTTLMPIDCRATFILRAQKTFNQLCTSLLIKASAHVRKFSPAWLWLLSALVSRKVKINLIPTIAFVTRGFSLVRLGVWHIKRCMRIFLSEPLSDRDFNFSAALEPYIRGGIVDKATLLSERKIANAKMNNGKPVHRYGLYISTKQALPHQYYPLLGASAACSLILRPDGMVKTHYACPVDITVIVPVYGVAQYVGKCADSLLNQSFTGRYEVLFINDGTKDESVEVIEKKIDGRENFRVITKENGGAASARNMGIEQARGKYLCFVDGDDYVSERYLQVLYDLVCDGSVNVAQAGFAYVDDQSGELTHVEERMPLYCRDNVSIAGARDVMRNVPGIWRRIYNRQFLADHRIQFNTEFRRHDDLPFNIHTLLAANDVAVSDECIYYYVIGREGQDVSATDERMFIHFRLFDDVFKNEKITALTRAQRYTFLKVVFSHHLWAYMRLEEKFRPHYLTGFYQQIFQQSFRLLLIEKYLVLLRSFWGSRQLITRLLLKSLKCVGTQRITDENYHALVDSDINVRKDC